MNGDWAPILPAGGLGITRGLPLRTPPCGAPLPSLRQHSDLLIVAASSSGRLCAQLRTFVLPGISELRVERLARMFPSSCHICRFAQPILGNLHLSCAVFLSEAHRSSRKSVSRGSDSDSTCLAPLSYFPQPLSGRARCTSCHITIVPGKANTLQWSDASNLALHPCR